MNVRKRQNRGFGRHLSTSGVTVILALVLAACASSSSGSGGVGRGSLTIGVFLPFSGSAAMDGPFGQAICDAASTEINADGGILGRHVNCVNYDSGSDPVDAVPVANRMLASATNLVFVLGPDTVEPAVEPVLLRAKMVHFASNGLPSYDFQSSPLYYRSFPSDSQSGVAEGIFLMAHGYSHAAAIFSSDPSSQTQVPDLLKTYARLGGHIAINLSLTPGTTYRTEVSRVLATKPDAIVTELDPQSALTFFTELAQQTSGPIPPIVATGAVILEPDWITDMQKAIGSTAADRIVLVTNVSGSDSDGPGYPALKQALVSAPENIQQRDQYYDLGPFNMGADCLVDGALAIDEAKSFSPSAWAPLVKEIANGVPGALTVNTYAQGLAELKAGHKIHFVGAAGQITYNKYNNIFGPFEEYSYQGSDAGWVPVPNTMITPQQIQQIAPSR